MTFALFPRTTTLCTALLLAGCASHGATPDPTAGADNPANPKAQAAPPPRDFTLLRSGAPPRRAAPAAAPASQSAGVYVCPMHPEVTSDKPGICPKCRMKLVPRKAGAPATTSPAEVQSPSNDHDHGGPP